MFNSCLAVITNFDLTVNYTKSECSSSFALNYRIDAWPSSRQGKKAKENSEEDRNRVSGCVRSVISIIPVLFSNPVASQGKSVYICRKIYELEKA